MGGLVLLPDGWLSLEVAQETQHGSRREERMAGRYTGKRDALIEGSIVQS
jgi:hypothetical protein